MLDVKFRPSANNQNQSLAEALFADSLGKVPVNLSLQLAQQTYLNYSTLLHKAYATLTWIYHNLSQAVKESDLDVLDQSAMHVSCMDPASLPLDNTTKSAEEIFSNLN